MSDHVPEGRTLPGAVPGATTGDTPGTSHPVHGSGLMLAQEIIEAYGGISRWNRLDSLRADIAFAGFGFRVKFLKHLPFRGTMVVQRGGQRVTLCSEGAGQGYAGPCVVVPVRAMASLGPGAGGQR